MQDGIVRQGTLSKSVMAGSTPSPPQPPYMTTSPSSSLLSPSSTSGTNALLGTGGFSGTGVAPEDWSMADWGCGGGVYWGVSGPADPVDGAGAHRVRRGLLDCGPVSTSAAR